MILLNLVALAVLIWLVWDIRRALRLRTLPPLPSFSRTPVTSQSAFTGALPPERYVVIRWPQGQKHYGGADGAAARKVYEYAHPLPGETVEFWENSDRRGEKVG